MKDNLLCGWKHLVPFETLKVIRPTSIHTNQTRLSQQTGLNWIPQFCQTGLKAPRMNSVISWDPVTQQLLRPQGSATCGCGLTGQGLCCRSACPRIEPRSHSWHRVRLVKGVRLQHGRPLASAWCFTDTHQSKIKVWHRQSSDKPFLLIGGNTQHTTELFFFSVFSLVFPVLPGVWVRRMKFCFKTDCLPCKQKAMQPKMLKCGFLKCFSNCNIIASLNNNTNTEHRLLQKIHFEALLEVNCLLWQTILWLTVRRSIKCEKVAFLPNKVALGLAVSTSKWEYFKRERNTK